MPPTPSSPTPRIILYYQTHHTPTGDPISVLPLLTSPHTTITHLILAALHLNGPPAASSSSSSSSPPSTLSTPPTLTLNDHHPSHPRNQTLWAELSVLRASGVKILAMLGGAARGTFALLDAPFQPDFESAYKPLYEIVRARALDGLDLDVEEEMSLEGIIRLIDRLKSDFGEAFIVTLAPVAAALLDERTNLSGFDYAELERRRGGSVGWYNAQFYCGWGDVFAGGTGMYDAIVWKGWKPDKVVLGLVTNPENGSGWVPFLVLRLVLGRLREKYGVGYGGGQGFGGIMGWEYFNALPGGRERPWEWATAMTRILRGAPDVLTEEDRAEAEMMVARRIEEMSEARRRAEEEQAARKKVQQDDEARKKMVIYFADRDEKSGEEAAVPREFEYFSDGDGNDREDALLPRSFEYFTDESLEE